MKKNCYLCACTSVFNYPNKYSDKKTSHILVINIIITAVLKDGMNQKWKKLLIILKNH